MSFPLQLMMRLLIRYLWVIYFSYPSFYRKWRSQEIKKKIMTRKRAFQANKNILKSKILAKKTKKKNWRDDHDQENVDLDQNGSKKKRKTRMCKRRNSMEKIVQRNNMKLRLIYPVVCDFTIFPCWNPNICCLVLYRTTCQTTFRQDLTCNYQVLVLALLLVDTWRNNFFYYWIFTKHVDTKLITSVLIV